MNHSGATRSSDWWSSWAEPLSRFGAAAGLTVSLYDEHATRKLGPFAAGRLGAHLANTTLWTEAGPGTAFEQALVRDSISRRAQVQGIFMEELRVGGLPLILFGEVRGVITFGWCLTSYASGLGSEKLARAIGGRGPELWRVARLEAPVTEQRMAVYQNLLTTIVESGTTLRETVQRLESLGEAREQLLAQVSHELRTPIGAIGLRLLALLESDLSQPAAVRASLEAMQGSVFEEARLVEDLIEAATTRTGRLSVAPTSVELTSITRAAVDAIRPAADKKLVSLSVVPLPGDDVGLLEGDPQRLKQAFWNVLANAVKFTPKSGTVELRLERAGRGYQVKVTDSGPGIQPDILPQIFEPFARRQSDNATGLGLGLTIAKQIVEMHCGSIHAENRGDGHGARFVVTLPPSRGASGRESARPVA